MIIAKTPSPLQHPNLSAGAPRRRRRPSARKLRPAAAGRVGWGGGPFSNGSAARLVSRGAMVDSRAGPSRER